MTDLLPTNRDLGPYIPGNVVERMLSRGVTIVTPYIVISVVSSRKGYLDVILLGQTRIYGIVTSTGWYEEPLARITDGRNT